MRKETMNTTTNLFILLIVTLFIIPATAIRYAHGQPVPQENNNTGNSTSTGGLPPPPPPATTANPPTSSGAFCPDGLTPIANGCPNGGQPTTQEQNPQSAASSSEDRDVESSREHCEERMNHQDNGQCRGESSR